MSTHSFVIGYRNKEAQEKFAIKCKGNREYGIISDIMYDRIMKYPVVDPEDEILAYEEIKDKLKDFPIQTLHECCANGLDDYVFADFKIFDIVPAKEEDGVFLLWRDGGF